MRPRKKVSRTDQSKNNGRTLSYALRLKHERTSVHEGLYVRILLRADLREVLVQSRFCLDLAPGGSFVDLKLVRVR
jgi:hypothetical protein